MSSAADRHIEKAYDRALDAFENYGIKHIKEYRAEFAEGYKQGVIVFGYNPAHRTPDNQPTLAGLMCSIEPKDCTSEEETKQFVKNIGTIVGGIDVGADLTIKTTSGASVWNIAYQQRPFATYIGLVHPQFALSAMLNGL